MSDDRTPEQMAEVALAALCGGLFAIEHDDQFHGLRQLREQLDLLSKWAIAHNDPDGRMLASMATALRLLSNGSITGIVRRVAVTLQKPRPRNRASASPPDNLPRHPSRPQRTRQKVKPPLPALSSAI